MNRILCVFLVFYITIILLIRKCYTGVQHIINDNKSYYITKKLKDEKIKILINVKKRVNTLLDHLRSKYTNNKVRKLIINFSGEIEELENSSQFDKVFAYNLNKGSKIAVCLHRDENELNDINEIMFVVIHELAHVMTEKYDHNAEFWESFKFLLQESMNIGIYTYKNYNINTEPFCKYSITHSPLIR